MSVWSPSIPLAVGGVVAIGFINEDRLLVGSHSGCGEFETRAGQRIGRYVDSDYGWYQADPPSIRYPASGDGGIMLVGSAGLWGGSLPTSTSDGWVCSHSSEGAQLSNGHESFRIPDAEELRAFGFSPQGSVFVLATSSTVTLTSRDI